MDDVVAFEAVEEADEEGHNGGDNGQPDKPLPRQRPSTHEHSSNQKLTDFENEPDGPTTTNSNNNTIRETKNNNFLHFLAQIFPNNKDKNKSQSRIHPQQDLQKVDDRSVGSHFSHFNGSISNMLHLALGNMSVGSMTRNDKKNRYKVNDNNNDNNNGNGNDNGAGKSLLLANTNDSANNSVVTDNPNRKKDVTDSLLFRVCKPLSEVIVETLMPNVSMTDVVIDHSYNVISEVITRLFVAPAAVH